MIETCAVRSVALSRQAVSWETSARSENALPDGISPAGMDRIETGRKAIAAQELRGRCRDDAFGCRTAEPAPIRPVHFDLYAQSRSAARIREPHGPVCCAGPFASSATHAEMGSESP